MTFNWFILAESRIWGGICNCSFMIISGYFLSDRNHFSWQKIIKLYCEVWFYSVISGIVVTAFYHKKISVSLIYKFYISFYI